MPRLAPLLARSSEVLVLSALGWALALATAASALGLSKEVGAFLAGFSLASTAFRDAIGGRLVSLRDFLLLFFFLNLGAELDFSHISVQIGPAIALVLFVLLGKPLIIMVLLGALGYRARTSLMTALTGSQISEFSLIFVALGTELGHVTSYTILLADPLHERLTPYLRLFERKVPKRETAGELPLPPKSDVLIFGLGRYGGAIAHRLREHGLQILGIDFDPEVVTQWRQAGLPAHYGDADDPEVISGLPLSHIPLVICAIPTFDTNLALLRTLRLSGYTGTLALTAHTQSDADRLKKAGADLVLCPFADAAERAADILLETVTGQQPSEQRRTVIAAPGSASVSGEKPGELLASTS
jgi:Kef-type K+ transport system membrane component KefB